VPISWFGTQAVANAVVGDVDEVAPDEELVDVAECDDEAPEALPRRRIPTAMARCTGLAREIATALIILPQADPVQGHVSLAGDIVCVSA
jgi:hypothetical protein